MGGWRLPNLAELGYLHDIARNGNGLPDLPGADPATTNLHPYTSYTTYPYWSSTSRTAGVARLWIYWPAYESTKVGPDNALWSSTWWEDPSYFYSARCVRTMD